MECKTIASKHSFWLVQNFFENIVRVKAKVYFTLYAWREFRHWNSARVLVHAGHTNERIKLVYPQGGNAAVGGNRFTR